MITATKDYLKHAGLRNLKHKEAMVIKEIQRLEKIKIKLRVAIMLKIKAGEP